MRVTGKPSITVKWEELKTVDSLKFMPCTTYMQDWVLSLAEIAESPFDVTSLPWDQGVSAAHLPGVQDVLTKRNIAQIEHLLHETANGADDKRRQSKCSQPDAWGRPNHRMQRER